jgi:hypothetical protein
MKLKHKLSNRHDSFLAQTTNQDAPRDHSGKCVYACLTSLTCTRPAGSLQVEQTGWIGIAQGRDGQCHGSITF